MAGMLDPEAFQNVLNSLPSGIYLLGRERKIVFWNQGAERITGYMRHEVVGRLCREDFLAYCDQSGQMLSRKPAARRSSARKPRSRGPLISPPQSGTSRA